ncbi:ABC transporter substrate-binding protein [Streptomyces avicenniae]|uniref:ABC transporter substrate-binding protein n=1 Tax=Streptomyces avicenniae TaxID=500153 RepID=UPI000DA62182|nr:ABC transporter substrate-binding protein [Streptomyces avicenniae]
MKGRGAIGIGLAMVLVMAGAGGWVYYQTLDENDEPISVGTTMAPTVLDPAGAYDIGSWALTSNLFQSLLTFVPGKEQPVPDAAESCDFTDEELTVFRCTLRDDLRFSNGNAMTPDDVKFSYERIIGMAARAQREAEDDTIPEEEKFAFAGPAGLLGSLAAVRTDGQDVIFELNQSDATFPFIVAGAAGAIVDRQSYQELDLHADDSVVGSGPFVLDRYVADDVAELSPNPNYSGAADPAENAITVRYFVQQGDGPTAEEQLAEAWENEEIDVNGGVMPPEAMAELNRSDPDIAFAEQAGANTRVMGFNTDEDRTFGSRAARRAVAALIDREAIARRVQQATVQPLYSLIPAGFTGHSTPYYDLYYDMEVEDVREELTSAGLELPVQFDLAYSRGAANTAEAEFIAETLEESGLFEVTTTYYDWSEFVPTLFGERAFDAYLLSFAADFPDPATFTDNLIGPVDGIATGFSDDEINALIEPTRAVMDRGRVAPDFEHIHQLAAEEAPVIPIWQETRVTISTSDIAGIQQLASNSGVWRLWELHRI